MRPTSVTTATPGFHRGRSGPWRLTWSHEGLGASPPLREWIEAAESPQAHTIEVLKSDHRTDARLVRAPDGGDSVVLKRDLRKNRDPWIRFCTLFRDSEAAGHLKGLLALSMHGVPAPVPLLAGERRSLGMVVDGWVMYRFRPGTTVPREREGDMVRLLAQLHEAGLYHRDVHVDNFRLDGDTVFLLDFKLRRNRFGAFARYYDLICLERRRESGIDVSQYIRIDRGALAYRLASRYFYWKWPAHRTSTTAGQ